MARTLNTLNEEKMASPTDTHATRLFNPVGNIPKPKKRGCCDDAAVAREMREIEAQKMTPKEGPGPIGSTGYGEVLQQEGLQGSGPTMPWPEMATGVPAPGGGQFYGPGGMAPPFAPGGPENPYPASAGMPPTIPTYMDQVETAAFPGQVPPGAIKGPTYPQMPPGGYTGSVAQGPSAAQPLSAQGSVGAFTPNVSNVSGVKMPNQPQPQQRRPVPGQLPAQRPGFQEGFMARIIPVSGGGGLQPGFPTQPLPPEPPGVGGGPIIPPGEPPMVGEPGFPGQLPTMPGVPGLPNPPGESGQKPRGYKILPMPRHHQPPDGPPKPPGSWVTVDAGRGQPPAYAFVEVAGGGGDTGLEPTPKRHSGTGLHGTATGQYTTGQKRSGEESGESGHYVPILVFNPAVPTPVGEEEEREPVWAWVPTISMEYGVKHREPEGEPKPEPKK